MKFSKLIIMSLALFSFSGFAQERGDGPGNNEIAPTSYCRVVDTTARDSVQDVRLEGEKLAIINNGAKIKLSATKIRCSVFGPAQFTRLSGEAHGLRVNIDNCNYRVDGFTGEIIDELNEFRITSVICQKN